MRTFLVMRYTPDGEEEYLTVEAHSVQFTSSDTAEFLIWSTATNGMTVAKVVRMLSGIVDCMDVELTKMHRPVVH